MGMKTFHFLILSQLHCLLGRHIVNVIQHFVTLATCVCSFIIGLSMTLTATQLITERKEGVIDRTWVAGGPTHHVMSHDLTTVLQELLLARSSYLKHLPFSSWSWRSPYHCFSLPLMFMM